MSVKDDQTPNPEPVENQQETVNKTTESEEVRPKEYGGPKGKEPTRYGDWERKGRCIDF